MKDMNSGFDNLDYAILEELQINGRVSVADLARKIHLSQPAVHNRIKRLEKSGVIRQYVALLDREVLGLDLLCFIQISVSAGEQIHPLLTKIKTLPEVLECYRLAGEFDVLVKVAVTNTRHLDGLIEKHLAPLEGVGRIQTSLVINEAKSTTALKVR
jgi:DNA-binding Lrp family transcriptional regulator